MSNQENQSVRENSKEIATILDSIKAGGCEPTEFDLGFIEGVVSIIKSKGRQQEGG